MTIFRNTTRAVIAASALAFAGALTGVSAHAQFPGDLFVEDPTIQAAPGDLVDITVQGFSGSIPFGAAGAVVTYDEQQLELVSAERFSDGTPSAPDTFLNDPGAAVIAFINGEDLDGPIGTVEIATLSFRLADTATGVLAVDIANRGYVDTSGDPYPNQGGFGADIFVTRPNAQAPTGPAATAAMLSVRADRLRRPGFPVNVVGNGKIVRFENIDPNAPSD